MKHVWFFDRKAGDHPAIDEALPRAQFLIQHIQNELTIATARFGPPPDLIIIDAEAWGAVADGLLRPLKDARLLQEIPVLVLCRDGNCPPPALLADHPLAAMVHDANSEIIIADALEQLMAERRRLRHRPRLIGSD